MKAPDLFLAFGACALIVLVVLYRLTKGKYVSPIEALIAVIAAIGMVIFLILGWVSASGL